MSSLRLVFGVVLFFSLPALNAAYEDEIKLRSSEIEGQVVQWRRFFHEYPELSNREFETSKFIANELNRMGFAVEEGMFAMLPSGSRLVKHRDPYAGSLRYHLGLVTANSSDCFLSVDGDEYYWKDGEAILFDETFIHFAENKSEVDRIILFLDIKRPVTSILVDHINQFFSGTFMAASTTENLPGDRVGLLNRAFGQVYKVRMLGKKIKEISVPFYYALTYSIYAVLIYLIFF